MKALVVVSLRGGWDALNAIVPWRDDGYARLRPTLALPAPGKAVRAVLDLDGTFGLHPALAPLLPLYRDGRLAVVHAAGWRGGSHSHFEAWEEIESGVVGGAHPGSGWLARTLIARGPSPPPLRALAFAGTMPRLLAGAPGTTALRSVDELDLAPGRAERAPLLAALDALYRTSTRGVGESGTRALAALEAVEAVRSRLAGRGPGAYPQTTFGRQLQAVEALIGSEVGLEAVSVELGGWDTHFGQGGLTGAMANLLGELAQGLAAFAAGLGPRFGDVTTVVLSEFGRRLAENGSGGTDHGQAGAMLVLGGRVAGGRAAGTWPTLDASRLAPPGDLAITTDFRDVLLDVVAPASPEDLFPGHVPGPALGLVAGGAFA